MSDTGIYLIAFAGLLFVLSCITISRMQRTIDRQNDTIQRLIQREPVTYAEVGMKPTKKSKEIYAAWGSQMVNIDEDEQHA